MPVGEKGQQITFAVVSESSEHFSKYVWITVRVGQTIAQIAAEFGQPELAETIAKLNNVRSIYQPLLHAGAHQTGGVAPAPAGIHRLMLPGIMRNRDVLSVLADDPAPLIKDGYALYDVINVPGRKGISRFLGFNPVAMDVPIQWEQWADDQANGVQVEEEIARLERLAGRQDWHGPVDTPPAVIRLSTTDARGHVVSLIPRGYQWMPASMGMLYRITGIAWDPNPKRRKNGNRVSQKAVVTVTEYTPVQVAERSSSTRSRQRNTKGGH